MNRDRRRLLASVAAAAVVLVLPAGPAGPDAGGPALGVEAIVIEAGGNRHRFRVEVADTPSSRMRGLQGRHALPPDAGMLFLFDRPQPVAMWMKDTHLSLDMLFIDEEGVVRRIAEATEPGSLTPIPSGEDVSAVLEVVAGTARRLAIAVGDRVEHRAFGGSGR